MGLLDDLFRQIGDFWGSSSKSNNKNTISSSSSSSSSSISSGVSGTGITKEERKNQIKRKYNTLDAENKLKGVLFSKLINNTNDIIGNANNKKENTKF